MTFKVSVETCIKDLSRSRQEALMNLQTYTCLLLAAICNRALEDSIPIHNLLVVTVDILPPLFTAVSFTSISFVSMGLIATFCTSREEGVKSAILARKIFPLLAAVRKSRTESEIGVLVKVCVDALKEGMMVP
jgi:hypothetical protein